MQMFNKIGAVILLVSDMKKSIKFYGNVLGMELKQHPSKDWAEFSKEGNTVLALHPIKKKNKKRLKKNNSMLVGFNISDLDTLCSDLKKKRIKFHKKLTQEQFGKHAIIQDPDGHLISLAEIAPEEEFMQSPYYHGFAPV
jgi:lactoylglutathione lyase